MPTIKFTWWNLENLFDTDDDPISMDFEFTAEHGWTPEVFKAKKQNLAAALNATHNGTGPELLAVAEIEKDEILGQLINEMGNSHLKVVRDKSGTSDLRGIDVAIAYDDRKLDVVSQASHIVHLRYATRDIFEVEFVVKETQEKFVLIASHWPSRRHGKYESDPSRIAVAENIAFLVSGRVKVDGVEYDKLRDAGALDAIQTRWDTKVMIVGDFNDEPGDRSVVDHLKASHDLDRVIGETNDIDGFKKETADYRALDVFLYNPMWKFPSQPNVGTFFLDTLSNGEKLTNRYAVLDQIVVSRGLVNNSGLSLDLDSVAIFRDPIVATASGRPRAFNRKTKKGTSDHLPLTATLSY